MPAPRVGRRSTGWPRSRSRSSSGSSCSSSGALPRSLHRFLANYTRYTVAPHRVPLPRSGSRIPASPATKPTRSTSRSTRPRTQRRLGRRGSGSCSRSRRCILSSALAGSVVLGAPGAAVLARVGGSCVDRRAARLVRVPRPRTHAAGHARRRCVRDRLRRADHGVRAPRHRSVPGLDAGPRRPAAGATRRTRSRSTSTTTLARPRLLVLFRLPLVHPPSPLADALVGVRDRRLDPRLARRARQRARARGRSTGSSPRTSAPGRT